MKKNKKKYYVVWKGYQKGIFDDWQTCKAAVSGFPNAAYKSFSSLEEAKKAFADSSFTAYYKKKTKAVEAYNKKNLILDSIAVDGACNMVSGQGEYQAVWVNTNERIFHRGPFHSTTNNIVEYLAIVDILAYCKKQGWDYPIYSDSKTAISWVKRKKHNSKTQQNHENIACFKMLVWADQWLLENSYTNRLIKWETEEWGENPADFNRK